MLTALLTGASREHGNKRIMKGIIGDYVPIFLSPKPYVTSQYSLLGTSKFSSFGMLFPHLSCLTQRIWVNRLGLGFRAPTQ